MGEGEEVVGERVGEPVVLARDWRTRRVWRGVMGLALAAGGVSFFNLMPNRACGVLGLGGLE